MVIAALICFAALVVAWIVAPDESSPAPDTAPGFAPDTAPAA